MAIRYEETFCPACAAKVWIEKAPCGVIVFKEPTGTKYIGRSFTYKTGVIGPRMSVDEAADVIRNSEGFNECDAAGLALWAIAYMKTSGMWNAG